MGRIKSTAIKRTSRELLVKHPDELTKDFNENKGLVGKHVKQKKFRNSIAGYIARLVKMRQKKEEKDKAIIDNE